jgi:hypothetical protein
MGRKTNASRRVATEATMRQRAAAMRAESQAKERRQRIAKWSGGGLVAVVVVVVIAAVSLAGHSSTSHEVIPPGVGSGAPDVQQAALVVPNTTGIKGVVAYDTTGWPTASHNGPAAKALGHNHVDGPVTYSVTPPVGGDHNAEWMNCGVYDKPVPTERAVHNLEHGAIWITYQPSLPKAEIQQLQAFEKKQSMIASTSSRYVDVTPYPGLPTPIVATSWGFQLRLSSPTDPRLQQFVNKLRFSRLYSPEYTGPCTGGVGTPLQP